MKKIIILLIAMLFSGNIATAKNIENIVQHCDIKKGYQRQMSDAISFCEYNYEGDPVPQIDCLNRAAWKILPTNTYYCFINAMGWYGKQE